MFWRIDEKDSSTGTADRFAASFWLSHTETTTAMRFRFGGGEEQLFVADILPMLDVEDEENVTSSPDKTEGSAGDDSSMSDEVLETDKQVPTPHPKLRLRGKIDRLRREVRTLGVELAGLQRAGRAAGGPSASPRKRVATSRWRATAEKRLQQRQRAEHDNKVLKRMITAQHMLAKSILNGRIRISTAGCRSLVSSSLRRYPRINA